MSPMQEPSTKGNGEGNKLSWSFPKEHISADTEFSPVRPVLGFGPKEL